ncbi:MAG: LacI family DNA-binding transcriptional regulator [Tissierellia bacterium]|nr:LacI family DNA-binding transcriptional regulator [Tissierellia bacterium]
MKPTIRNIAELAGVSPTSVSMVLNDRPIRVSEETKARIFETAKSLGYSKKVRSDREQGGVGLKTIGLIYPSRENHYWNGCVSSIEEYGLSHDIHVLSMGNGNRSEKLVQMIQVMKKIGTKGLIVIAPDDVNEDENHTMVGNALFDYKKPFVLVDRAIDRVFCDFITIDNRQTGYLATEQLLAAGSDKVGVVIGEKSLYSTRERVTGYKEALSDSGISIKEEYIFYGSYDEQTGYAGAKQLVENGVQALFAGSDGIAKGIYRYCMDVGMDIGQDLSVIGVDNDPIGEWISPPLTTIGQSSDAQGKKALEILMKRIEKEEIGPVKDLLFMPQVINRSSLKQNTTLEAHGEE